MSSMRVIWCMTISSFQSLDHLQYSLRKFVRFILFLLHQFDKQRTTVVKLWRRVKRSFECHNLRFKFVCDTIHVIVIGVVTPRQLSFQFIPFAPLFLIYNFEFNVPKKWIKPSFHTFVYKNRMKFVWFWIWNRLFDCIHLNLIIYAKQLLICTKTTHIICYLILIYY